MKSGIYLGTYIKCVKLEYHVELNLARGTELCDGSPVHVQAVAAPVLEHQVVDELGECGPARVVGAAVSQRPPVLHREDKKHKILSCYASISYCQKHLQIIYQKSFR